mmetsp:Transcript_15022/g.49266  ORF Transcript_15022/g.49266 Transcript_15022/m.49266 type:complete len:213 (+) Transcript_15022:419-1057(+)
MCSRRWQSVAKTRFGARSSLSPQSSTSSSMSRRRLAEIFSLPWERSTLESFCSGSAHPRLRWRRPRAHRSWRWGSPPSARLPSAPFARASRAANTFARGATLERKSFRPSAPSAASTSSPLRTSLVPTTTSSPSPSSARCQRMCPRAGAAGAERGLGGRERRLCGCGARDAAATFASDVTPSSTRAFTTALAVSSKPRSTLPPVSSDEASER